MRYSHTFVTALATIAAKAAKKGLSAEDAVNFAWFSVGQDGDAEVDADDFARHLKAYKAA